MLGKNDVLVMRVAQRGQRGTTYALTRRELDETFGEVKESTSWETVRCYHFPQMPPAAGSFAVFVGGSAQKPVPRARPGRTTATTKQSYGRSGDGPLASAMSQGSQSSGPDPSLEAFASRWAQRAGTTAESTEYLRRIQQWRDAWRPPEVRILLVAESHVAEQPGDMEARVQRPPGTDGSFPDGYCRLVYCLGYGENEICTPAPRSGNSGTIQYWDLFGAVVGGVDNRQPRKSDSDMASRLAWKIEVLRKMVDHGIWLVDASVLAFYVPGGGRPFKGSSHTELLRESWTQLVWPSVAHEPIEQVWVIGKGVFHALAGRPGIDTTRVISQPQTRDADAYRRDVKRITRRIGVASLGGRTGSP